MVTDQSVIADTGRFISDRRGSLLLHAGAVDHDGSCAVVHGASGVGKTTLTAALTMQGLAYITDETVCLDAQTLAIEPFRKPLTIKPGSHDVLARLRPEADSIDEYNGTWHVDPEALLAHGAMAPSGAELHPTLIVFPDRQSDVDTVEVRPVTRARAAFLLGEQSSALWTIEPRPLAALARLVSAAPAVAITYSDAFAAAPVIVNQLLDKESLAPIALASAVSDRAQQPPLATDGPARHPDVDWIELDGEAVLFNGVQLHHLDVPAAAVWQRLDGTRPAADIAIDLATQFQADPQQVLVDVDDLLRMLDQAGVVRNFETTY